MAITSNQPDEHTCPLCGADNRCAMASGKPIDECWCRYASLDKSALEAIPEADRGVRCICPACGLPEGKADNDG